MTLWPIERIWIVEHDDGTEISVKTGDLAAFSCCVVLGSAGLGKSVELHSLAKIEAASGKQVRFERLVMLGTTATELKQNLDACLVGATADTVLYLDAVDEVMVPLRTAAVELARWIRDKLAGTPVKLRISCRSAVWPRILEEAIKAAFAKQQRVICRLQPLAEDDVRLAAQSIGISGDDFLKAVRARDALALASQPVSLRMLLQIFKQDKTLPRGRKAIFAKGVQVLVAETQERIDANTTSEIGAHDLLEASERLACFLLFSGRDSFTYLQESSSASLSINDIESMEPSEAPLEKRLLDALARTGLFEGEGQRTVRFGHRQFAEYLAGRRIAKLPLHQAKSLLSASVGHGVAHPLRETASFAAIESQELAEWVTENDPEVIGLSDVTNDELRRRATLALFDRFRRRELTDAQIIHDQLEVLGLKYSDAEEDLRSVLVTERATRPSDALEFAVHLIRSWNLESMSDDLASLMLDPDVSLDVRRTAGYALCAMGSSSARSRVLPLIEPGKADDVDEELRGLALRCNWPDRISVPDLLKVLAPPRRSNYHGAYSSFLFQLGQEGVTAEGHTIAALEWASQYAHRTRLYDDIGLIVQRIAVAALDEIQSSDVQDALSRLLVAAARAHGRSPLSASDESSSRRATMSSEIQQRLANASVRRLLIDGLIKHADPKPQLWFIVHDARGLLDVDDCAWLMAQASDASRPLAERERFVDWFRMLPWMENAAAIEAWLAVRDKEPIASSLNIPLQVDLDSAEADRARRDHREMVRHTKPRAKKQLRPSQRERIEVILDKAESGDPMWFANLVTNLTIDEDDDDPRPEFNRFVTSTPGWLKADSSTQERILRLARRLLDDADNERAKAEVEPLNSILPACMPAFWLLQELDEAWLEAKPQEWWSKWCWYILRESHPHLSDEPQTPVRELLLRLHRKAPPAVHAVLLRLAKESDLTSKDLFENLLDIITPQGDAVLTRAFSEELLGGRVPANRVSSVGAFVLRGGAVASLALCLDVAASARAEESDAAAVEAAIVLLSERKGASWPEVHKLLLKRRDLARPILGGFAGRRRHLSLRDDEAPPFQEYDAIALGELLSTALELFPTAKDPDHHGAYSPDIEDHGRELRNAVLQHLVRMRTVEAVGVLRSIESAHATEEPWLRRARAEAERGLREWLWRPVPAESVALLLAVNHRRLIRSEDDALAGVKEAISGYAGGLRGARSNDVEDFWNHQKDSRSVPKSEERASDKVCEAIRQYYQRHAVTADREVQIFRRNLDKEYGGAPGSKPDVIVRVSSVSTLSEARIAVPVEVKYAHNQEAKTALLEQLVDRYMREAGTNVGVFVLIWPGSLKRYKPLWRTIDEAKQYLEEQAATARSEFDKPVSVEVIVVDVSLKVAAKRSAPSAKRKSEVKGRQSDRRITPKSKSRPTSKRKASKAKLSPVARKAVTRRVSSKKRPNRK